MKKTLRANHVLVRVYNFEEACRWYEEKLSATFTGIKWQNAGMDFAYYDINDFRIEIVGGGQPKPFKKPIELSDHLNYEGFRHLCFEVDDVDKIYEELKSKGVKFLPGPIDLKEINKRLAHFLDNSGNVIELMSDLK